MFASTPPPADWQTLNSRIVYQGWLTVMQDRLLKPTGDEMEYTYINTAKMGAVVLAFTTDRQVVLTRQYRHPLGRVILDIPGGGVQGSESPEETARREFTEETGYQPQALQLLGQFLPAPGLYATSIYVYVAESIEPGKSHPDEHELVEVVLVKWKDLLSQVLAGEPMDGALAYAVLLYQLRSQLEKGQSQGC